MAKAARNMAAAMALVLGSASIAASQVTSDAIVLHLDNQCRLPVAIVEAAQQVAAEIYAPIGVRFVWTAPGEPLPAAAANAHRLTVRLTAREGRLLTGTTLSTRVLGVAPLGTRFAYVFCRRVTDLASLAGIRDIAIPLGRAIAHEIGHLMLPGLGHSDTGIMRASLDIRPQQSPGFTEREAESIRTLLMASN